MHTDTGLSSETDQTIINLAHAFDGYEYARLAWPNAQVEGISWLKQLEESGRLSMKAEINFAINFLLHRGFRHQGWLPGGRTQDWYNMLYLYLHLYRLPIPGVYRHSSLHEAWANRSKGSGEAAAAEIRQILRSDKFS